MCFVGTDTRMSEYQKKQIFNIFKTYGMPVLAFSTNYKLFTGSNCDFSSICSKLRIYISCPVRISNFINFSKKANKIKVHNSIYKMITDSDCCIICLPKTTDIDMNVWKYYRYSLKNKKKTFLIKYGE